MRYIHEVLAEEIDIIVFDRNQAFKRMGRIKDQVMVSISRTRTKKAAHKYFLWFVLAVEWICQTGPLVGNVLQPYQTPGITYTWCTVPDKFYKEALHVC